MWFAVSYIFQNFITNSFIYEINKSRPFSTREKTNIKPYQTHAISHFYVKICL